MFIYKTTRRSDGTLVDYRESIPGTGNFDQQLLGPLPPDAVPYAGGGRVLNPYTPEANATINLAQFGLDKYYSPTFHFQVDFGGWESVNDRRRYGVNTFGFWNVGEPDQLRAGEGFYFLTENFLGDQATAHGFNMESLQTFVTKAYPKVPAVGYGEFARYKYLSFNIEAAITLDPGNKGSNLPGFPNAYYSDGGNPDWNSVKGNSIQMETTGEWITLEALAARGYTAWYNEFYSRLATRMAALCEMARLKAAPGVKISSGSPLRIALPNRGDQTSGGTWIGSDCKVDKIGGDSQGNITLALPDGTSWTVKLNGCLYDHEDFNNMAIGRQFTEFSTEDFNDIWVQKKAGTQTVPYVWSKEKPKGIVAEEKGLLQHQRQRMRTRLLSHSTYPVKREVQLFYESRSYELPFVELQGLLRFGGNSFRDTPRLWHPPVDQYGRYVVIRFFAGDEPDWGFHLFPQSQYDCLKNPLTFSEPGYRQFYNHSLHSVSALYQARADMQYLETYYPGSTLVEDPEVQIGATGSFQNYNGVEAFDTYPNPQKPAYILRWKAVPGGYRVVIVGGIQQNWTDEHTDVIRLPNGGLGGAKFRMKLIGNYAHIYEFFVASADAGLTYDALPTAVPSRTKPAYSGWIIND